MKLEFKIKFLAMERLEAVAKERFLKQINVNEVLYTLSKEEFKTYKNLVKELRGLKNEV